MRFLFCCEFYYPGVGGVVEVMRQIAERMVARGHEVTVATTRFQTERTGEHNGVKIEYFSVAGNEIRGLVGEVERYRDFVVNFPADAILIKAAQQWTFDALFPVLDQIKARKLFIPCGFSNLYEPLYRGYFRRMPDILKAFDQLIFYASSYRDVDFCRGHGFTHLAFLSNGADEKEFATTEETEDFKKRLGIPEENFVFSTVGNMTGIKGHREVAEAFLRMDPKGRPVTLVLNGNPSKVPSAQTTAPAQPLHLRSWRLFQRSMGFLRREGFSRTCRRLGETALRHFKKMSGAPVADDAIAEIVRRARLNPLKQVLITDLPRQDVIDLFKTTDLYVFASNIEYSPLVLFEAAAAGTPFLTVPVGNAEEIAAMTGGGIVCAADKNRYGYTRVAPAHLADMMMKAMSNPDYLTHLGEVGRKSWEEKFTWDKIATHYEALLTNKDIPKGSAPTVSVLLPVFNGGALLEKAVHSILGQTFGDFELLVLDDGSTDDGIAHIRKIDDPRLRILGDRLRYGTAVRLNQGIGMARGLFIARMDADDIAFPERLERQVRYLGAHPEIDLLGCRAVIFRDKTNIIGLHPFAAAHKDICAEPWRGFPLPHPTWMGRASWFYHHRYKVPEVVRAEDQELLLRSYATSHFACLPDVLLAYHQRQYDLRKTLIARRYLLAAQMHYFLSHRQWKSTILAFTMTTLKVAVDLLASLPGCEKLFFVRMSGAVPDTVIKDFRRVQSGDDT